MASLRGRYAGWSLGRTDATLQPRLAKAPRKRYLNPAERDAEKQREQGIQAKNTGTGRCGNRIPIVFGGDLARAKMTQVQTFPRRCGNCKSSARRDNLRIPHSPSVSAGTGFQRKRPRADALGYPAVSETCHWKSFAACRNVGLLGLIPKLRQAD